MKNVCAEIALMSKTTVPTWKQGSRPRTEL